MLIIEASSGKCFVNSIENIRTTISKINDDICNKNYELTLNDILYYFGIEGDRNCDNVLFVDPIKATLNLYTFENSYDSFSKSVIGFELHIYKAGEAIPTKNPQEILFI